MVFLIQHYVITYVSDLQQVDGVLNSTLRDNICQRLTAGRLCSQFSITW